MYMYLALCHTLLIIMHLHCNYYSTCQKKFTFCTNGTFTKPIVLVSYPLRLCIKFHCLNGKNTYSRRFRSVVRSRFASCEYIYSFSIPSCLSAFNAPFCVSCMTLVSAIVYRSNREVSASAPQSEEITSESLPIIARKSDTHGPKTF